MSQTRVQQDTGNRERKIGSPFNLELFLTGNDYGSAEEVERPLYEMEMELSGEEALALQGQGPGLDSRHH